MGQLVDVPLIPVVLLDLVLRLVDTLARGIIVTAGGTVVEKVGFDGILLGAVLLTVSED